MPGMGQTLTNDVGPLPVWAWAEIGTVGLAAYLIYQKRKSMTAQTASNADQSNLGTVPVSNLTVGAEPMPTSTGPTFVDVTTGGTNTTVNNPAPPQPPAHTLPTPPKPAGPPPPAVGGEIAALDKAMGITLTPIANPTQSRNVLTKGYNVYTVGNAQYYNPAQKLTGNPGVGYTYVSNPTIAQQEVKKGKKLTDIGSTQWVAGTL